MDKGALVSTQGDEPSSFPSSLFNEDAVAPVHATAATQKHPGDGKDDNCTADRVRRYTPRRLPLGIRNVSGVSCHVSAALQLIYHGLPEVRDILLKCAELPSPSSRTAKVFGALPSEGTTAHPNVPVDKIAAEWNATIFLKELARLFCDLASKDRTEAEAGEEAADFRTGPVDPTRLYDVLPPSLDCRSLGDAATALRVILATLRAAAEEDRPDSDDPTAMTRATIMEELRCSLEASINGSSSHWITGRKIIRAPKEEENDGSGGNETREEDLHSASDANDDSGGNETREEDLHSASDANEHAGENAGGESKCEGRSVDKKEGMPNGTEVAHGKTMHDHDEQGRSSRSVGSGSESGSEHQTNTRKRITRTKPSRERKWTCPFPVPVRGYDTLQESLHGATTERQPIVGYDWDNVEEYSEEVECLPVEDTSVSSSESSSDSESHDGTDGSDSSGSGSDSSSSEESNGSSSTDDSSDDEDSSSSSSSSSSSDNESGRFRRWKRKARTKCSRCARRVLSFLPQPDDESSGSGSSSELSFFTVESFTNTTDSSMTSSSYSPALSSSLSSPCSTCSKDDIDVWKTEKMSRMSMLPQHLILHLKRFDYVAGKVQKIASELDVPIELDLSPYLTESARSALETKSDTSRQGGMNEQKPEACATAEKYGDVSWVGANAFLQTNGECRVNETTANLDACKNMLEHLHLDDAGGDGSVALTYQLRGAIIFIDDPLDPTATEVDEDAGHYMVLVRLGVGEVGGQTADWVCIDDENAFANTDALNIISGRSTDKNKDGSKYSTVVLFSKLP